MIDERLGHETPNLIEKRVRGGHTVTLSDENLSREFIDVSRR